MGDISEGEEDRNRRKAKSRGSSEEEHELGPVANTHKQSADDYSIGVAGKLTRVGYYTLSKTLGRGKYGKVKLGTHDFTGEKVAVKCIDKSKLRTEDLALLYREVRIHGLMDHPNIMKLYEVLDTEIELCLVLEYCGGGELYDYVVARGRLSESEARRIYRQIISAVNYFHSIGVVHRDLKLENVQMDDKGNCKVGDFGFSRFYSPHSWLLRSCGSPKYSCPEILTGIQYRGPEVDLFSLGVMLYALVVGKMPFESVGYGKDKFHERITRMENGEIDPSINLPLDCESLVRKLICKSSDRIKMSAVLEDTWLRGSEGPLRAAELVQYFYDAESLDDTILARMADMGWPRREVEEALRSTESNEPMRIVYGMLVDKKQMSLDYRDKGAPLMVVGGDDGEDDDPTKPKKFDNDFFSIYEEVGQRAPRPRSPEYISDLSASAPAMSTASRTKLKLGGGSTGEKEKATILPPLVPPPAASAKQRRASVAVTGSTPKSTSGRSIGPKASSTPGSNSSSQRLPDVFSRLTAPTGKPRDGRSNSLAGEKSEEEVRDAAAMLPPATERPKPKTSTMVKMSGSTGPAEMERDTLPPPILVTDDDALNKDRKSRSRSPKRPSTIITKGPSLSAAPPSPRAAAPTTARRPSYDSATISSAHKTAKVRPLSAISTIVKPGGKP